MLLPFLSYVLALGAAACVPDFPDRLLSDPTVLQHPSVVAAFEDVTSMLSSLYIDTTRDGLSFAVVHVSTADSVFTFNNGSLKMNETEHCGTENLVTSESIFRVLSVSKNIAMASVLAIANLPRVDHYADLSLNTLVRTVLPEFSLPEKDWNDGGKEITLGMLASHTAGIPRESYSTSFNMVLNTGKADAATIGAAWASATTEDVIKSIANDSLMFAPGRRAAYSNAGIGILGASVAAYYNNVAHTHSNWSEITTKEVLEVLNMTHTFFGPIPRGLVQYIGVPGGENWADLVIGEGYNPAAGMWSSANDLAKYLHHIWLSPNPSLVTKFQRRGALKPVAVLPDGVQQVGPGWEVQLLTLNPSMNASTDSNKTYSIYGKSGDGGGWHSWIDVIPNLGYGLVILSQNSVLEGFKAISPTALRDSIHKILAPAFSLALSDTLASRFAGIYSGAKDTGLLTDTVKSASMNTTSYARLEVQDQVLYIRELVINGSSALEAVDRLSWVSDTGPRYFSTKSGVALEPAEGAEENAEFGQGAQVWRMNFPDLKTCDWFDFDGYKDSRGWPLSKVVLVENTDGVELRYPPFDVAFTRNPQAKAHPKSFRP